MTSDRAKYKWRAVDACRSLWSSSEFCDRIRWEIKNQLCLFDDDKYHHTVCSVLVACPCHNPLETDSAALHHSRRVTFSFIFLQAEASRSTLCFFEAFDIWLSASLIKHQTHYHSVLLAFHFLSVQPMFCVLRVVYLHVMTSDVLFYVHFISMCEAVVVQAGKALGCWLFGLSSSSKISDLTWSVHGESLWRVTASWWTSFLR